MSPPSQVNITPTRLTVRLSWAGTVLDGPLAHRIKASEATWALVSSSSPGAAGGTEMQLVPPKVQHRRCVRITSLIGICMQGGSAPRRFAKLARLCFLVFCPDRTRRRRGGRCLKGGRRRATWRCGPGLRDVDLLCEFATFALSLTQAVFSLLFVIGALAQILKEMMAADDPAQAYDDLSESAKDIVDEMRERQAMVASGEINLETSMDDYRLVLGDN